VKRRRPLARGHLDSADPDVLASGRLAQVTPAT
jgi:hypothetical protein